MSRIAQQAVSDYFDVLLQDDPVQNAQLETLFSRSLQQLESEIQTEPQVTPSADVAPELAPPQAAALEVTANHEVELVPHWRDELAESFQCLYFKVAELVIAVPLQLLGGIKRISPLNQLPGSAPWLLGIQSDSKLQVVDTAKWLMLDKAETVANYQYMVQLENSAWALACDSLLNAEPLTQQQVKWRQGDSNSQPYLAGIVRDRMCVVLDIPATIEHLNSGKDISKEPKG